MNKETLTLFLTWVDNHTYILDDDRYLTKDNTKVTTEQLADMFLSKTSIA